MRMILITHANYSNVPSFAHLMAKCFAGVAVLPNRDVMAACLHRGANRRKDVSVELWHNGELRTAYRVGGEYGELIVIDAETGASQVYDLGASDEDSVAACTDVLAELQASSWKSLHSPAH